MRVKFTKYTARSNRLKRSLRASLKNNGYKRPVAILRARRRSAGIIGRGCWWDTMLDINRDMECGKLKDVLCFYDEYIQMTKGR